MAVVAVCIVLLLQEPTVSTLIERLGSDKIDVREEAARRLLGLGKAALPELEKAAREGDAEVSRRAKELVKFLNPSGGRDAFENIEAAVLRAHSVRIAFKGETLHQSTDGDPDLKTTFSGEVLLKDGNKAWYTSHRKSATGAKPIDCFLVSDGSKMTGTREADQLSETPSGLKRGLTLAVSRLGPCAAATVVWAVAGFSLPAGQGDTAESTMEPADFTPIETDGESKVFGYMVKAPTFGIVGKVRLWYNPRTYALVKRTLIVASRKTTITEVYDEYALNPELAEEKFRLPDRPK